MTGNERFRAFCRGRDLSLAQAAQLFGVSESLAQAWAARPGSSRYREMRTSYVKLLDVFDAHPTIQGAN